MPTSYWPVGWVYSCGPPWIHDPFDPRWNSEAAAPPWRYRVLVEHDARSGWRPGEQLEATRSAMAPGHAAQVNIGTHLVRGLLREALDEARTRRANGRAQHRREHPTNGRARVLRPDDRREPPCEPCISVLTAHRL